MVVMSNKKKTKKFFMSGNKAKIFVLLMLAYPLIHFAIFYIFLNLSSVTLAFQGWDDSTKTYRMLPPERLFDNFKDFFNGFFNPSKSSLDGNKNLMPYFINGAIMHGMTMLVSFPTSIIFSYIIYKKVPLAGAFKVILYLPAIISGMVITLVFKWSVDRMLPELFNGDLPNLLMDQGYIFRTVLAFQLFMAMPGSIILNTSTLSRIPVELVESGKLEGITMFQEFRYIALPLMYSLLQVYLLGVFVGFFTATGPLYALYEENAETVAPEAVTFGYYMLTRVVGVKTASEKYHGFTAAANLSIGLIALPIVYLTKWLLDKFNPGAEY